jgi:large subunit ribosomal protein L11
MMGEQSVDVVVEGGKASAAPPLGPALGPMGIDIQAVVDSINEKTKDLAGLKVPVKVIIDTATKGYRIEVGKPPASALILKELGLKKGAATTGKDRVGDLSEEQVKKVARAKFGSDEEGYVNQIKGTCRSMGVTIGEGKVTEEERMLAEQHKLEAEEAAKEAEKKAEGEEGAEEGEAAAEGEEVPQGGEGEEKPAEEKKGEKPGGGEEKKEES